jgi:DnaJ-class molecular chaperone
MTKIVCPRCEGLRFEPLPRCASGHSFEITCSKCHGTGSIPHPTCQDCGNYTFFNNGDPKGVCSRHGDDRGHYDYCNHHTELED